MVTLASSRIREQIFYAVYVVSVVLMHIMYLTLLI